MVIRTTALGIATVWLYAAIRPRFASRTEDGHLCRPDRVGPVYVFTAIVGGQSIGAVVVIIAWTGVEMLIASSVGGYLYHES